MTYKSLQLTKGKEKAIRRRHPWVFSGAFNKIDNQLVDGEVVEVQDFKGNFLALGFFRHGSIAVSIISFEPVTHIDDFIKQKLTEAINYRETIGLLQNSNTNCCRLVFAEGDHLSGLIIDKYADTAVLQIHHPGWLSFITLLATLLIDSGVVKHVYSKPADKLAVQPEYMGTLAGSPQSTPVFENGHKFLVDWEEGQKTGFFLDQRNNRKKLGAYAQGKNVLNTFSYTGGFSVYALANGATKAISVDSSHSAIELANKNAELNGFANKHQGITSDVFEYMKSTDEIFDLIVLDPPAFSKNRRSTHNAVQAYKRLNLAGIKKVKRGGFIFTFSCSQHVDLKLFEDTIRAAAIESNRQVRIVERLTQPADHPVNIYHPEGEYLKGLILAVN
jgi:23S rRNA (cytosine1962-C5)-methyltransferase